MSGEMNREKRSITGAKVESILIPANAPNISYKIEVQLQV